MAVAIDIVDDDLAKGLGSQVLPLKLSSNPILLAPWHRTSLLPISYVTIKDLGQDIII